MKTLVTFALALTLFAQEKKAPDPAFAPIQENPALPRVLLIGDSISMGYTLPVRQLLNGKANVLRVPTNAETTKVTLDHIDEWLGDKKWDVIHVNCGLHDLKIMKDGKHQVALKDYEQNLEALIARLKKTGAKIIFATTTPVPEGVKGVLRHSEDVPKFNAAALAVMKRNHIPIDDLNAVIQPKLSTMQLPVNVHYTKEGYEFLAQQVAAVIAKQLPAKH